jgi:hypothetical protein
MNNEEITRKTAIEMNNNRLKNQVLLYIKDEGPIYKKDINFISKNIKRSNTETFIIMNRSNIALANKDALSELQHKNRVKKYKEEALKWSNMIEIQKQKNEEKLLANDKYKKQNIFNIAIANLIKLI